MSTQISFLDLPGEICNWIYRNTLVWNHSIPPKSPRKPKLPLNLLLANKKVYDETRSILYSQNSFDFITRPSPPRPTFHSPLFFLDKIGPENSKWIESLELQFPIIRLRGSEVELDNVSASILDKVQSSCPSLKRLTLDTVDTIFDGKKVFDCTLTAIKAFMWKYSLDLVAARLRAISQQLEVTFIINSYCDCVTQGEFKAKLDTYGWKLPAYNGDSWSLA